MDKYSAEWWEERYTVERIKNEALEAALAARDKAIGEAVEALAEIYNADFWGKLDVTERLRIIAADLEAAVKK